MYHMYNYIWNPTTTDRDGEKDNDSDVDKDNDIDTVKK